MSKRRVEWKVRLRKSNYERTKDKLIPQVVLARNYTLDDIIARITADGSAMAAETLLCAAQMLMNEMEDCLIEGASISTPMGNLTPAVTGVWSTTDRHLPQVRQQNTATLRYTLSRELKRRLSDPLFSEMRVVGFRLCVFDVEDTASRTEDECLTPGRTIVVHGHMLLMNGDLPQRGLYLIDAATLEEVCHITPEEMVLNTRGRIIAQMPHDLAPGEYMIRVVSQCTTGPRPMKQAAEYIHRVVLRVPEGV